MYSRTELEKQVKILYAGRCAESIVCGEDSVTTGAANDITKASEIIKSMIVKCGMSEYGLIDMSEIEIDKKSLLKMSSDLTQKLYEDAYNTLEIYKDKLIQIAEKLMDSETLTGDEIKSIFEN